MITVHHLDASRSERVLWLLEELGVPYQVKHYARDAKTGLAPAALRAIHPLGKAPIVVDGAEVLVESGAILETLAERYGGEALIPPRGSPDFQRYRTFLHYAEGSAMPWLLIKLVFDRLPARAPLLLRPMASAIARRAVAGFVAPQLRVHLDFMEAELAARPWFAGETFSLADIQMSFPLEAATGRAGLDASRPNLFSFVQRIKERPAYRRAAQRARETPYVAA